MNLTKKFKPLWKSISQSGLAVSALLVFFLFYFSLYLQNIPYEQEPAVGGWMEASQLSWGKILYYLFRPVSQALSANNSILIQVRVTEHLALKLLHQIFGDSMGIVTAYNVSLALILAFLVFRFIHRWTGHVLAGFLCVLFLLATPAYGWAIMEYGDFSPLDQILLLCYLGYFMEVFKKIVEGKFQQFSKSQQALRWFGLWFLGMIALRAKEPNMFLVPGLSWLLFFLNPSGNFFKPGQKSNRKIFSLLGMILFLLSLPIILVRSKPVQTGLFSHDFFENLSCLIFYNPYSSPHPKAPYAGEKICALFSLKDSYPSTILANYGCLLLWFIIFSCLCFAVYQWSKKEKAGRLPGVSAPLLLTGWIFLALMFNGAYQSLYYTRYLTWVLLPLTLFITLGLTKLSSLLAGKKKIIYVVILLALVSVKIGENFTHSIYTRKGLERIWVAKWTFRNDIYKDQTNAKKVRLFDLYRFWNPRTEWTRTVEPFLWYHVGLKDKTERDLEKDGGNFKRMLQQFGFAYVTSDYPMTQLPWEGMHGEITQVDELDTAKLSLLTSLNRKFSKKVPPIYYLYRVSVKADV